MQMQIYLGERNMNAMNVIKCTSAPFTWQDIWKFTPEGKNPMNATCVGKNVAG